MKVSAWQKLYNCSNSLRKVTVFLSLLAAPTNSPQIDWRKAASVIWQGIAALLAKF
jgi:hypothetical protein